LSASKSRPATVVVGTVLVDVDVVLGRVVDDDVLVDVVVGRLVDEDVLVDVVVGRVVDDDVLVVEVLDVVGAVELLDVLGVVDVDDDVDVEVVVGLEVDVELDVVVDDVDVDVVVGLVVDDDVELVVGIAVDVELLDDVDVVGTVVVAGRELDVLVVELEVVVVFLLRAIAVVVHVQAAHGPSGPQSGVVSHSSPAATSRRPSPQVDAAAVKRRRFVERAESFPTSVVHDASSFAVSRTASSVPHADQRTRMVAMSPR
jgi:hypothetical protein